MTALSALQLKIPPLIYMLTFAGLMWLTQHYLPIGLVFTPPWHLVGLGLMGLALIIDLWALGLFLRAHTTINPLRPLHTCALVTTGLYRYTRNPMYLGLVILLSGWGIYLGSLGPFCWLPVFIWILTIQQILPEEKMLAEKFGDAYRAYQTRVPRWI